MKIILVTRFGMYIQIEQFKQINDIIHYKRNLNDKKWQSISRSNFSHIQCKDVKTI